MPRPKPSIFARIIADLLRELEISSDRTGSYGCDAPYAMWAANNASVIVSVREKCTGANCQEKHPAIGSMSVGVWWDDDRLLIHLAAASRLSSSRPDVTLSWANPECLDVLRRIVVAFVAKRDAIQAAGYSAMQSVGVAYDLTKPVLHVAQADKSP